MSQSNSTTFNLCQGFFVNGLSKSLTLIFSVVVSTLIFPFLYGIIWYEKYGTDSKRTLINQLVFNLTNLSLLNTIQKARPFQTIVWNVLAFWSRLKKWKLLNCLKVASICWRILAGLLILQFPTDLQFMLHTSYNPIFCAFVDFSAATLFLQVICKCLYLFISDSV